MVLGWVSARNDTQTRLKRVACFVFRVAGHLGMMCHLWVRLEHCVKWFEMVNFLAWIRESQNIIIKVLRRPELAAVLRNKRCNKQDCKTNGGRKMLWNVKEWNAKIQIKVQHRWARIDKQACLRDWKWFSRTFWLLRWSINRVSINQKECLIVLSLILSSGFCLFVVSHVLFVSLLVSSGFFCFPLKRHVESYLHWVLQIASRWKSVCVSCSRPASYPSWIPCFIPSVSRIDFRSKSIQTKIKRLQ